MTKLIMHGCEIPCEHVFEVKGFLAKLLGLPDIRYVIHLCCALFLHPRCFCLAYHYTCICLIFGPNKKNIYFMYFAKSLLSKIILILEKKQ